MENVKIVQINFKYSVRRIYQVTLLSLYSSIVFVSWEMNECDDFFEFIIPIASNNYFINGKIL